MRGLRYFLYFLCSIGVLFLILILSFYLIVTPRFVKNKISAHVEQFLHAQITWNGTIQIKKLPSLIIYLPRITIHHTQWEGKIHQGVIQLRPWNIFTRAPKIEKIILDHVNLEVLSTPQDSSTPTTPSFFHIHSWKLTNTNIKFGNFSLEGLQLEGTNFNDLGTNWQGSAQITHHTNTIAVQGWGDLQIQNGSASIQNTQLEWQGLLEKKNIHLKTSIAHISPSFNQGWLFSNLSIQGDMQHWNIQMNVPEMQWLAKEILTKPIQATLRNDTLDPFSLQGSLHWDLVTKRLHVKDLVLQNIHKNNFVKGWISIQNQNLLKGDLQGLLWETPIQVSLQEIHDAKVGRVTLGKISTRFAQYIPQLYAAIQDQDSIWNFTLTDGLPFLAISPVQGNAIISKGTLQWHIQQLPQLSMYGNISQEGLWQTQWQIKDIELKKLFVKTIPVQGLFSGQGQAQGHLFDQNIATVYSCNLDGKQGFLQGIDLYLADQILQKEYPSEQPFEVLQSNRQTPYQKLSLSMETKDGTLTFLKGRIQGQEWHSSFYAKIEPSIPLLIEIPVQWTLQDIKRRITWPISLCQQNQQWVWDLHWDKLHQNSKNFIRLDPWSVQYWIDRTHRLYNHIITVCQKWLQSNLPWPDWFPWEKPDFLKEAL